MCYAVPVFYKPPGSDVSNSEHAGASLRTSELTPTLRDHCFAGALLVYRPDACPLPPAVRRAIAVLVKFSESQHRRANHKAECLEYLSVVIDTHMLSVEQNNSDRDRRLGAIHG